MIVKTGQADGFAARPPAGLAAVLVYGPDRGLVKERADALAKSVVPDLGDPFRVAELDETILDGDPARLWDEAAALSMTGGRRVVRVRGAGNGLAKAFERFLESPLGDALIVLEGGDLTRTGLRRLFEEAENAAAIACYPDTEEGLETLVRAQLKAHGLGIEPGALHHAVARLGADRGVTRQELEKLALYALGGDSVTEAQIDAVLGDESELRMEDVFDAAGEGDYVRLDRELARAWAAQAPPVGVVRQAISHFHRLLAVKSAAAEGRDAAAAIKALRPPLHFSRTQSFRAQVSRWSESRIEDALSHLYEAEALAKTTAVPAEAATGRALLTVAALARASR
jgi:DNA polymerase-3 subunit delta